MSTPITFGRLPMGAIFSPAKGAFQHRPFKKTAISPGTDVHGGNALYLQPVTRRDGDVLRHPGRHFRCQHFRFRDTDEVKCQDPTLAHAIRLEMAAEKAAARRRKGKSEWFFDVDPKVLRQHEEDLEKPHVKSKRMRVIQGAS